MGLKVRRTSGAAEEAHRGGAQAPGPAGADRVQLARDLVVLARRPLAGRAQLKGFALALAQFLVGGEQAPELVLLFAHQPEAVVTHQLGFGGAERGLNRRLDPEAAVAVRDHRWLGEAAEAELGAGPGAR